MIAVSHALVIAAPGGYDAPEKGEPMTAKIPFVMIHQSTNKTFVRIDWMQILKQPRRNKLTGTAPYLC